MSTRRLDMYLILKDEIPENLLVTCGVSVYIHPICQPHNAAMGPDMSDLEGYRT